MVLLGKCHEKQRRKVAERLRSDMVSRFGSTYSRYELIPAMVLVRKEMQWHFCGRDENMPDEVVAAPV